MREDSGYDILGWFVAGPEGSKAEAHVDGKPSGIVFDTSRPSPRSER